MKTEQEKAELVALYRAGTPVDVLCERFDICKSTAYNWIQKFSPIKRASCVRTVTPDSYYRLEREMQTLRTENEIIRRSGFLLSVPLGEKIETIDRLKSDFSVYILCKTLGVLKSTYYHHKLHSPARKWYELNNDKLRPLVKEIFDESRERFGARKIKHALNKQGYVVSEAHVSHLMKEMNLVCKQVRLRYFSTTNRKYKYYRNKVQRKFETEAPNLVWVSDFTSVYVKDAPYSIAVIIDLYARMVVACVVMANATAKRMIGLFDTAFEQSHRPDDLTFHSDQGTQYTAYTFRKHLRDLGVNQSFSNPGTPLDNAVAESFFSCMKREELSHNYYDTVDDLKRDVADYVVFFNNMRSHRKLGMLTPCEAEQQFELEKN